ncbi:hypothetical protein [Solwaraspora sp. WMMA2065]|uniref:hypothetical protein n=1 Tax=Solwaraspora sp. WMMA2065 TaxID=3015166 RepID=UPI00259B76B3|nr:hypothetical protein [Solwaraspora sp. WMMA2065]WJK33161.1 hypothetical protein O7610_20920 [Solwaraspora sp. WMMA2065]
MTRPTTPSTGRHEPPPHQPATDGVRPRPAATPGSGHPRVVTTTATGQHPTSTRATSRDATDRDLADAVRRTTHLRLAFYVMVLLVALVGQVTGAVDTLDIPALVAVPAVAALELGGVVVMANADVRRRLGERAIGPRLLSAAIAAAAVTFNWTVHPDHLAAGFYAGMSALGYLVWLMHAGNQRRDRLRATGDLPPTPPAYELINHWARHPAVTARAHTLAKTHGLDLYESLDAARAAITRERRDAAIATVLHRKIRAAVDTTTADIAVHVYDLNEIATRLAATADYTGLTALIAADLTPERIITTHRPSRRPWTKRKHAGPPRASDATPPAATHDRRRGAERRKAHDPGPVDGGPPPAGNHDAAPQVTAATDGKTTPNRAGRSTDDDHGDNHRQRHDEPDTASADTHHEPGPPRTTAEAVAYWLDREPDLTPEQLAEKIGKSLRSVYRNLPHDYPRQPGIPRDQTRRHPNPTRRPSRSTD